MKLSVCMITYNHEHYIREAIEGILLQETTFDFELIIANDKSTDKTEIIILALIENHPKGNLIKYFSHTENKGMMANFIFALQQCEGKYIALCDGDDYWTDPQKLQKQIDYLEANPDYVLCFHQIRILKTDGSMVDDFLTKVPENCETIETLAKFGNYIHTPSVVYRNVLSKFPFEFEKTPIGDYFLYMMLAEHGKLKYMEEMMAVYRYGIGILTSQNSVKITIDQIRFYSCLLSYLNEEHLKSIFLERQYLAIDRFLRFTEYHFTSNRFLAEKKSLFDLIKIALIKVYNKFKYE
jgi:glycosyltransferase involved in cell wall biosynthesis